MERRDAWYPFGHRYRRWSLVAVVVILAAALATGGVFAQTWPQRPISVYVGWAAGGSSDIVVRALVREMEEYLGRPIQVTNVTGALGAIGATQVAQAPADGYLWFGGAAVHGTWPVLDQADVSWTDFYSWLAAIYPTTVYVRQDAPWQTLDDLVEAIRTSSRPFKYGHPGPGSNGAIFADLLMKAAGVGDRVEQIPYTGGREAGRYLLAGEIDFVSVTMGDISDWAAAGQVRPIANLFDEPVELEGVVFPPVTEQYPELAAYIPINPYFGIYLRRETPEHIVTRITEAFLHAVKQDRFYQIAVTERAGVLRPTYGEEADKVMSLIESARSHPLFQSGVAPNDPAQYGIPTVADWSWPPHDRARNVRPWPESIKALR